MAEEQKGKGCLVGLLTIAGIIVVGICIVVGIIYFKGEDIMVNIFEQAKGIMPQLLTENHADEERAEFSRVFDQFIDEITITGFKEGIGKYNGSIQQLQDMLQDQRVTRDESQRWVQIYLEESSGSEQ